MMFVLSALACHRAMMDDMSASHAVVRKCGIRARFASAGTIEPSGLLVNFIRSM